MPAKIRNARVGARRACHSLFALGGRHHDGTGCGWGGAGGAEVEMDPGEDQEEHTVTNNGDGHQPDGDLAPREVCFEGTPPPHAPYIHQPSCTAKENLETATTMDIG